MASGSNKFIRTDVIAEALRGVADERADTERPALTADYVTPTPNWGQDYGRGHPSYWTLTGPVWMFRRGQRVRFYNATGMQVGPEQRNVAPAVAYALSEGWGSLTGPRIEWPS